MLEVEYGIPIPASNHPGRPGLYPFATMKVGGSFLLKGRKYNTSGGLVTAAKRRTGFEFTSRKVKNGVRIWRVK